MDQRNDEIEEEERELTRHVLIVILMAVGVAIPAFNELYSWKKKYEREENVEFSFYNLSYLYPTQENSTWEDLRSRTLQVAEGEKNHSFLHVVFAWYEDGGHNTEKECICLSTLYINYMRWALNGGVPMDIHDLTEAEFSHTDGESDIKEKLVKFVKQKTKRETRLWYIQDARNFPNFAFFTTHQFMNYSSNILVSILDVGAATNSKDASFELQNLLPLWPTEAERSAFFHNVFVFLTHPEINDEWRIECAKKEFTFPIHQKPEYNMWQAYYPIQKIYSRGAKIVNIKDLD